MLFYAQQYLSLIVPTPSITGDNNANNINKTISSVGEQQGIRSLQDKQDIFEDGDSVIKLGKHKFSVNTQSLDLTLLRRSAGLYRHLIGTDALQILRTLLPIHAKADLLWYAPEASALAMLFWTHTTATEHQQKIWKSHAQGVYLLSTKNRQKKGFVQLRKPLQGEVATCVLRFQLHFSPTAQAQSAEYLSLELAQSKLAFITSLSAENIQKKHLLG